MPTAYPWKLTTAKNYCCILQQHSFPPFLSQKFRLKICVVSFTSSCSWFAISICQSWLAFSLKINHHWASFMKVMPTLWWEYSYVEQESSRSSYGQIQMVSFQNSCSSHYVRPMRLFTLLSLHISLAVIGQLTHFHKLMQGLASLSCWCTQYVSTSNV